MSSSLTLSLWLHPSGFFYPSSSFAQPFQMTSSNKSILDFSHSFILFEGACLPPLSPFLERFCRLAAGGQEVLIKSDYAFSLTRFLSHSLSLFLFLCYCTESGRQTAMNDDHGADHND